MGSARHNIASLHHEDLVSIAYRRHPLRHHQHRRPRGVGMHRLLESRFGDGVEGRKRVVKKQHIRLGHEHARDTQALALTTGNISATLGDGHVQVFHEVGLGDAQCLPELVIGGLWIAHAQVGGHSAAVQPGLLRDHPDLAADADAARRGVVELREQAHER